MVKQGMRTPVPLAFTLKQMVESVMLGGGVWTTFVLAITHKFTPWIIAAISGSVVVCSITAIAELFEFVIKILFGFLFSLTRIY